MHEATPVLPAASVPRTQTLYTSVGWPGTVHFTFTIGDVLNAGVAAAPALTQVPPSRLYWADTMFEFPVFESSTFALSSNEVFIITGLGLANTLDVTGPAWSAGRSSSVIVPTPCASVVVALAAFDRLTKNVSSDSSSASAQTTTVMVSDWSPGTNVLVPFWVT